MYDTHLAKNNLLFIPVVVSDLMLRIATVKRSRRWWKRICISKLFRGQQGRVLKLDIQYTQLPVELLDLIASSIFLIISLTSSLLKSKLAGYSCRSSSI